MDSAMHPLDDRLLKDLVAGRLEPELAAAVSAHLDACPSCTQALAEVTGLVADFEALAESAKVADADAPLSPALSRRLMLMAPSRPLARWRGLAAAGLLLALIPIIRYVVRDRDSGASLSPSSPAPASSSRLRSPVPGTDLLLSERAVLDGAAADWRLREGSCLVVVGEVPIRIQVGALNLEASHAEFLVQCQAPVRGVFSVWCQAWAGEGQARVVVLDGRVAAAFAGERLELGRGDAFSESGVRSQVPEIQLAGLREGILPAPVAGPPVRLLGTARGEAGQVTLDGREAYAACLMEAPAEPYQAVLRVKTLGGSPSLGLSFVVGAESTLLPLPRSVSGDGAWHALQVRVTANWVVVSLDGQPLNRVRRAGFRANPQAGLAGVGLAVWGGQAVCADVALGTVP